jgi:hypothetical protein
MPVQHRTTRKNHWLAWSGELDDLRRIGRIFSELVQRRKESLDAELDTNNEPGSTEGPAEQWRRAVLQNFAPVATLEDGDDRIVGPVDDVLAELDRRSVSELALKTETDGYALSMVHEGVDLTFRRKVGSLYDHESVTLEISSRDQGWARQTLTQLTEEIEKGVPRWAWFRSKAGRAIIGLTVAIAGVLTFYSLVSIPDQLSLWGTPLSSQIVLTIRLAAVVAPPALLGYLAASNAAIDWFMPRFEVTSQASSTGGRRLAGLGLLVLSIPIGILVNLIS